MDSQLPELPPLPETTFAYLFGGPAFKDAFDAEQMRSYALLAIKEERAKGESYAAGLSTIADTLQHVLDVQRRIDGPLSDDFQASRVWPETPTRGLLKRWIATLRGAAAIRGGGRDAT